MNDLIEGKREGRKEEIGKRLNVSILTWLDFLGVVLHDRLWENDCALMMIYPMRSTNKMILINILIEAAKLNKPSCSFETLIWAHSFGTVVIIKLAKACVQ